MSLRVIASKNLLSQPDLGPIRPGSETLGQNIGSAMPTDMMQGDGMDGSGGGGAGKKALFAGALLLAVLGILIFLKARKKK
ncbi:hypothetical protein D3C87_1878200 [compost metagenome]